jgi:hypothetical protein
MKTNRAGVLAIIGLLAVGLTFLLLRESNPRVGKPEASNPPPLAKAASGPVINTNTTQTNRPAKPLSFTKRLNDMTEEEKAKLARDFKEKYTPLVEKWIRAYDCRVPFQASDFTLDKFHSRLGDIYDTFMIGDITFTIINSPRLGTKVGYLATREVLRDLNRLPGNGFVPDLSVPVTREEVMRMVKTDTGVQFKPNEIIIKPTGACCVLNGGAFVDVLPEGADANNGLSYKVNFVFGPDGKLLNYERDPSF